MNVLNNYINQSSPYQSVRRVLQIVFLCACLYAKGNNSIKPSQRSTGGGSFPYSQQESIKITFIQIPLCKVSSVYTIILRTKVEEKRRNTLLQKKKKKTCQDYSWNYSYYYVPVNISLLNLFQFQPICC